jgi:hypothetical protein
MKKERDDKQWRKQRKSAMQRTLAEFDPSIVDIVASREQCHGSGRRHTHLLGSTLVTTTLF